MIERLRSVGERLLIAVRRPGWQLVVGGAILALAFPSRLSGTIGLITLGGALGIGVAMAWPALPEWLRAPPDRLAGAMVVTHAARRMD